jgi:hypothetical protein
MLEYIQKHSNKIGLLAVIIAISFILLQIIKSYKEQPSQNTREIINREQNIIDSLSNANILLESKNQFLGSTIKKQDSHINKLIADYQNKKQVARQVKIEYQNRDSLIVGIDTTCEKYVVTLEKTNEVCDSLTAEQDKQISSYKEKDILTQRIMDNKDRSIYSYKVIVDALKLELKKRTKLFSIIAGPGVTYTTDKEIKAGFQITTGLKILEF